MGQSLSQLYVHLTFGTKKRSPIINQKAENQLHAYIAGTLKVYDSPAIIINSVPDHIHILFRLSKNFALAKIVEEIKKQSSKWMKQVEGGYKDFSWQIRIFTYSVRKWVAETALPSCRSHISPLLARHRIRFPRDYH